MKLPLHWKIIIGLLLGIVWAFISGYFGLSHFTADWIAPWGRIFIRLLKLIAVPLVLFTIIGGIVSLGNPANLGRLGIRTLLLYLSTTVVAVSIGLLLVNAFTPGNFVDENVRLENRIRYELWAKSNQIPVKDNKCYSCEEANAHIVNRVSKSSEIEISGDFKSKLEVAVKQQNEGPLTFVEEMVPSNIFFSLQDNGSMLKIIFFAILFGVALLYIDENKRSSVINLVDGLAETFLKIVDIIMESAPLFVFALMAGMVSSLAGDDIGKMVELFKGLGIYSLVVVSGLLIMIFVVYPLILKVFVPSFSIPKFFKGISSAQALAFSSSSSAATLPVTIECVEENLKVRKKICGFVLPIGATVNMDGTSLYQAIAAVFLAQINGIDLLFDQQLLIVLTATLASIGAAAVPSAGLVMLMVVLSTVGLNPAWIAIILPVDRILDMVRTVVNVTGDATVATIIDKTNPE